MENAHPRLIAIAGPCVGRSWDLVKEESTIGRSSTNDVHLQDITVSRKHCLITQSHEEVTISNLTSLNGTIVNGIPVQQQPLTHGARIKLGDSTLVFATETSDEETPPTPDNMHFDTSFRTRPLSDADIISAPNVEDLRILLKVSMELLRATKSEQFWNRFLQLVEKEIKCDGAAVVLTDKSKSPGMYTRNIEESEISESVIQQTASEHAGFILKNIDSKHKTKAVLSVPLAQDQKYFGVIYLTRSAEEAFTPRDLRLLSAIATIATLSMETLAEMERLQTEKNRLMVEIDSERILIGESREMSALQNLVNKAAAADSTVLISGESGTGKELVARAIHQKSARSKRAFIAINCAALPDTLLESELFGHEKGAFTGALSQVKGKIELADGGTLFLDEIGDMPAMLQAKLLRVLQEREFERLGGRNTIQVDIRVLAATNKDLNQLIADNLFRKDLYFRLNVISIQLPPLRNRKSDIPLLANYFLIKYSQHVKRKVMGFSQEANDYLLQYEWPGNVRELENVIERAVVLGCNDIILPEDLPENLTEAASDVSVEAAPAFYKQLTENKRELILRALKDSGGNYAKAAEALGISRTYLHRLARNLKIKTAD